MRPVPLHVKPSELKTDLRDLQSLLHRPDGGPLALENEGLSEETLSARIETLLETWKDSKLQDPVSLTELIHCFALLRGRRYHALSWKGRKLLQLQGAFNELYAMMQSTAPLGAS